MMTTRLEPTGMQVLIDRDRIRSIGVRRGRRASKIRVSTGTVVAVGNGSRDPVSGGFNMPRFAKGDRVLFIASEATRIAVGGHLYYLIHQSHISAKLVEDDDVN